MDDLAFLTQPARETPLLCEKLISVNLAIPFLNVLDAVFLNNDAYHLPSSNDNSLMVHSYSKETLIERNAYLVPLNGIIKPRILSEPNINITTHDPNNRYTLYNVSNVIENTPVVLKPTIAHSSSEKNTSKQIRANSKKQSRVGLKDQNLTCRGNILVHTDNVVKTGSSSRFCTSCRSQFSKKKMRYQKSTNIEGRCIIINFRDYFKLLTKETLDSLKDNHPINMSGFTTIVANEYVVRVLVLVMANNVMVIFKSQENLKAFMQIKTHNFEKVTYPKEILVFICLSCHQMHIKDVECPKRNSAWLTAINNLINSAKA